MNYIITFLIGMVPLIELRVVLFLMLSQLVFQMRQALIIGVVANMLPVPIIFFFARRVLEWGANKPVIGGFFTWCLKKGHKGGKKLADTAGDKGIFIALLLFVGIPIPGTGAWTGTLLLQFLTGTSNAVLQCYGQGLSLQA